MKLTPLFVSLCVLSLPAASAQHAEWSAAPALAQDAAASIRAGRAHLEAGRLAEARAEFEAALRLDGGLGTRVWLWRVDLKEGRFEDVLGAASAERRRGTKGPEIDFALGLALLQKCEADIQSGASGSVGLFLEDAVSNLKAATEADGDRFSDGFLPLARAAHLAGQPEVSLPAARRAQELDPKSVEARMLRGRAALSLWRNTTDDQPEEKKLLLFEEAANSFRGAAELLGEARTPAQQLQAAEAHLQLGHTLQFRGDHGGADQAYASALAFAPDAVDLQTLRGIVGNQRFLEVLRAGSGQFTARYGPKDPRDATLQWWLGWALFSSDQPTELPAAETAFSTAVEKWPAFVNSWYYLFRVRYARENWVGAKEALERYAEVNEAGLVDTLRRGDDLEFPRVEFVVAKMVSGGRLTDAAWLSEFLARALPQDDKDKVAAQWNNAGFFWRDAGDTRGGRNPRVRADAEKYAELHAMYERSFRAYSRALELDPENPAYLNDGAVILHYNLERDYELALEMYAKATVNAEKRLANPDLDKDLADIYRLALRDSRNNRRLLEAKIEAEKKREEQKGTAPDIR